MRSRKESAAVIVTRCLCCLEVIVLLLASQAASGEKVPLAQHVILIIEENTSFSTVVGPPATMPWLVGEGNLYGYAANYYSDASGSLLDYLWLASGSSESNFGCNGNFCSSAITDNNIFRLMNNEPLAWKVYALNYLNAGGTVTTPDNARGTHYYRRHNGATWYSDVLNNTLGSQGETVDFEQFLVDVSNGTLPRYSIIVPDGNYDAHDGSLAAADNFLKNNLAAILGQSDFQAGGSGLIIVTFDNGNNDSQGRVYTALIGPNVKSGKVSTVYYQHQSTLRTTLDALGIHVYPGASGGVSDLSDFIKANAGSVVINSPANKSVQGIAVPVSAVASELGSQIDHMEIWDNGKKIAAVFSSTVHETLTLGAGSHHMVIEDIGRGPNYTVLHKHATDFTVSLSNGVILTTPANNSTQALLFPVNAYAVEAGGNVDHLEVWADGKKLGNSPKGTTLSQWCKALTAGSHQLSVQDVSNSGTVLHKKTIGVTVSSSNNIYVNSPAKNSNQGTSVLVNAYAYEQSGSKQQVDHLEVWDNGKKLGNSPLGYGVTSLFLNQRYTLGSGSHSMTIQDIGPGPGYSVLHKSTINFIVP